jgi:Short C-terminal domain/Phospholipase_D-nuclease N-terminal
MQRGVAGSNLKEDLASGPQAGLARERMYSMSFLEVIGSIFWFMLLVAWFWLMIVVITDLFRDQDLSGWAKALWCLFVVLLPWLGVLMYLIVRGRSMNERALRASQESEKAFRGYVREAAGSGASVADELSKLADLRDRGVITAADYDSAKAKLLSAPGPAPVTGPPQPSSGSAA